MDEFMYTSRDILDEDVPFEVLPEAYSAPLDCPACGEPMAVVEATRSIASGRFVIPYPVYECRTCGHRYMNPEQVGRFSAILRLERLLAERKQPFERDILFDGRDLFVRLPLARELFQPRYSATLL